MLEIFEELPADKTEVEALLDLVFGPGRDALSSYRYRDDLSPVSELCLVVRDDFDVLAGVIRFWPVLIGSKRFKALLLGPLGVHPIRQGEGIGELLINEALKKATKLGWSRAVLVGDINYYKRFGFSRHLAAEIFLPDKISTNRLLAIELVKGSMTNLSGPLLRFVR